MEKIKGNLIIPAPKGEFMDLFKIFRTKEEPEETVQVEEKPEIPFFEGKHEWHEDLYNTPKLKTSVFIEDKKYRVGDEFICPACSTSMPPLTVGKPQACPNGDLGFLKMDAWTLSGYILVNEGVCVGKVSKEWLEENPIE